MGMGMPNMGMMGMGMGMGMAAAAGPPATEVICLANMLSIEELASAEYDEVRLPSALALTNEWPQIVSDIRDECSTFGTIEELIIPKPAEDGATVPGVGKAYIKFADVASAQKVFCYFVMLPLLTLILQASGALTGRTFDGKKVACTYISVDSFTARAF